jgi:uncharacterized protein (TIGR03067 family)
MFEGTWKGQETGASAAGECSLVNTGKNFEFHGADPNVWIKGTFTLREDVNPKQMVFTITDCPAPQIIGQTGCSIYRVEKGTLTITSNGPGSSEAPASFDAPGAIKLVLKKQ